MRGKYKPKPSVSRICRFCGICFETTKSWQVYCSRECGRDHTAANYRKANPPQRLPTATVGTISELLVAVDLLRKGYSVFRAVSGSCDCDLAILFDHTLCRVEVRTAHINVTGKLTHPPCDASKYDILALVAGEEITYRPEVEEWFSNYKGNHQ